jgi:hypothetical protein
VKETVDLSWHKARIAARILLKARTRALSPRDKRLAILFAEDSAVENRLIEQGIAYWQAPWMRDGNGNRVRRVCNVVD